MGRAYLLIILIGVAIGALLPSRPAPAPDRAPPTAIVRPSAPEPSVPAPLAASVIGGPSMTLERAAGGHFFADAEVNGMTVHFLIDTGASGVALTLADAQRVGLQFSPIEFDVIGTGASGAVRGKLVKLDRVSLGGRTVEAVDGAILEGAEMSLLGQSFLARMGSIEMSGDRMVIR